MCRRVHRIVEDRRGIALRIPRAGRGGGKGHGLGVLILDGSKGNRRVVAGAFPAASLANMPVIKGAVAIDSHGFLQDANLPLNLLTGAAFQEFVDDAEVVLKGQDGLPLLAVGELDTPHAFYNSSTPYTNRQALAHGRDAAQQLSMTGDDVVCVAITLGHAFGMGSAVTAALLSGATIHLPAVGGLFGCGVPSERAVATQHALEHDGCTLLFADTHTLKALSSPTQPLALRNGVVKIGSGATFLAEARDYENTMGVSPCASWERPCR